MALVDIYVPFNMHTDWSFGNLYFGERYYRYSDQFQVDYADGVTDTLDGFGFAYDNMGGGRAPERSQLTSSLLAGLCCLRRPVSVFPLGPLRMQRAHSLKRTT